MFRPEEIEDGFIRMQQEGVSPAQSEEYADFIVNYRRVLQTPGIPPGSSSATVSDNYRIFYVPLQEIGSLTVNGYSYNSIPRCYTCMDLEGLRASGITRLQEHPYLKLRGKHTAVAIIDTGIDYRNPIFISNGRSRIARIWDQTLPGRVSDPEESETDMVPYGRLFTAEDINRALEGKNPLEVVPSIDTDGHGTALAGLAAGNLLLQEGFGGAAPEADILVVKLKPAKKYLKDFYLLSSEKEAFQENDIMLGIAYALKWAQEMHMPLSICLGLGTSQGAHEGTGPLSGYVDYVTELTYVSVCAAAGNEGAARHHFFGKLSPSQKSVTVQIRTGEKEESFSMEFWGEAPQSYQMSIQSPTGETLEISSSLGPVTQELSFVFVETKVLVNYVGIEEQTGKPLVFFRFVRPAAGIWKINVQIRETENTSFHMWLPVTGLVSPDIYFLESSPDSTVTSPGDSSGAITVTAYRYQDNSLYLQAGRGFAPNGDITPHLAAPGVDMTVPLPGGGFGEASGTSYGTAQAAGAAALLFEWALVRGNEPYFTGRNVKNYLLRGARREENMQYPNPEWGYGKLDLYHTFELLT
ncbi:MAG: S8 family peptidase [Blautia sp.]|nr:S8 family peptidase [Blautia sp.]MDY5032253.1 S8 family peptidase [Blautia sp.]